MIEVACRRVIDATGRTRALALVVFVSLLWMVFGAISLIDPYPFQFLGVVCNVVQLWMIFVLAVGARGQARSIERKHDAVISHIEQHASATRAHLKRHVDGAFEIHRRDVRDHIAEVGAAIINDLTPKKAGKLVRKPAARKRR